MEFVELIKAPKVDNVILRRPLFPRIEGTLCITGHHLILSSRKGEAQEFWVWNSVHFRAVICLTSCISTFSAVAA